MSSDSLVHYGVKGMRWGVRRDDDVALQKTFPTGETLTVVKNQPAAIARFIAAYIPKLAEEQAKSSHFTLKDSSGSRIGEASFYKVSDEELNLVWIGVNAKHRGKGYATAVLKGVSEFAKKEGFKKMTLEVPGNSPDARHIYTKLGFVESGTLTKNDAVWGGLTKMTKIIESDDELKHFGVKGMRWGVRKDRNRVTSAQKNQKPERDEHGRSLVKTTNSPIKRLTSPVSSLTDAELQARVNRIRLEKDYKELTKKDWSTVQKGLKFATDILKDVATSTATNVATDMFTGGRPNTYYAEQVLKALPAPRKQITR